MVAPPTIDDNAEKSPKWLRRVTIFLFVLWVLLTFGGRFMTPSVVWVVAQVESLLGVDTSLVANEGKP